jgi:hypothetical protein
MAAHHTGLGTVDRIFVFIDLEVDPLPVLQGIASGTEDWPAVGYR